MVSVTEDLLFNVYVNKDSVQDDITCNTDAFSRKMWEGERGHCCCCLDTVPLFASLWVSHLFCWMCAFWLRPSHCKTLSSLPIKMYLTISKKTFWSLQQFWRGGFIIICLRKETEINVIYNTLYSAYKTFLFFYTNGEGCKQNSYSKVSFKSTYKTTAYICLDSRQDLLIKLCTPAILNRKSNKNKVNLSTIPTIDNLCHFFTQLLHWSDQKSENKNLFYCFLAKV